MRAAVRSADERLAGAQVAEPFGVRAQRRLAADAHVLDDPRGLGLRRRIDRGARGALQFRRCDAAPWRPHDPDSFAAHARRVTRHSRRSSSASTSARSTPAAARRSIVK
jgi:hypothetical protein